tara:strand:- start:177 stop:950 length:774 start_codon:yes stop_codon:yes gene_type:complete
MNKINRDNAKRWHVRMNNITRYMFDIDGTLTQARRRMSLAYERKFLNWMEGKSVFFVAGSDLDKVNEQLPIEVIANSDGVFCSMANQFWNRKGLVYENNWLPDPLLVEQLTSFQMYTSFPVKSKLGGRGKIFEYRPGMLNFTTIGRNANTAERERYYKWDKKHKERKNIVKQLESDFPDLDFRIGGQISIDIQPKGFNKSQASKWVRDNLGGQIVYFGDNCQHGGNDYDISLDVLKHGGTVREVKRPEDTFNLLTLE